MSYLTYTVCLFLLFRIYSGAHPEVRQQDLKLHNSGGFCCSNSILSCSCEVPPAPVSCGSFAVSKAKAVLVSQTQIGCTVSLVVFLPSHLLDYITKSNVSILWLLVYLSLRSCFISLDSRLLPSFKREKNKTRIWCRVVMEAREAARVSITPEHTSCVHGTHLVLSFSD